MCPCFLQKKSMNCWRISFDDGMGASGRWRDGGRGTVKDTDSPAKVKGVGMMRDMRPTGTGSEGVPPLGRRQRVLVRGVLATGAILLVGAAVRSLLATVPPTAASFYPKCLSHLLLGIHCPGCGLTRAAHSLLNGQLAQAFAYNPLLVLLSPYLAASRWCGRRGSGFGATEPRRSLFPARYAWLFLVVFVAFWVLRNIPVYPFTLLAPHEIG